MSYNILGDIEYLIDAGADEFLGDTPIDRTVLTPVTPAIIQQVPSATPVSVVVPMIAPKTAPVVMAGLADVIAESKRIVATCATLDELKSALENFDGCILKRTATSLVFGDGNSASRIMLVGEAPNEDEDRQGKPFVGDTGLLLTRMFDAIQMTRADHYYVTTIINWRPPGNRSPSDAEIAICLPFIQRHIEIINPKVLILVGGAAAKALLETTKGITQIRGKWVDYTSQGLEKSVPAMPIFHPNYLLKTPTHKALAWVDLQEIRSKINSPSN